MHILEYILNYVKINKIIKFDSNLTLHNKPCYETYTHKIFPSDLPLICVIQFKFCPRWSSS